MGGPPRISRAPAQFLLIACKRTFYMGHPCKILHAVLHVSCKCFTWRVLTSNWCDIGAHRRDAYELLEIHTSYARAIVLHSFPIFLKQTAVFLVCGCDMGKSTPGGAPLFPPTPRSPPSLALERRLATRARTWGLKRTLKGSTGHLHAPRPSYAPPG